MAEDPSSSLLAHASPENRPAMELQPNSSGRAFPEILRRETGCSRSPGFVRRVSASEVLVKRLEQYTRLDGHEGCVNTVHFNPSGDILVSGSDDTQIIFWDWEAKAKRFAYSSGHVDNVFQARIMPFTDDHTIVTAAADGQVRVGYVMGNGRVETKRLAKHQGRVHKLAIEPGSPHIFYSCGEDGVVQHFDLRSHSSTKLFSCSSLNEKKQPVPGGIKLNAIAIDPRNPNYFAVGGFDEYARVYDIRNYHSEASTSSDQPVDTFCPRHLVGTGHVHITGLAYSNSSELLVSYNDELVYLFQKFMGLGPQPRSASAEHLQKIDQPQVYTGHRNSETVKGASFFGLNDDYVVSGSDCGHLFIWKKKGGELLRMMIGDKRVVNCLEQHPYLPILATSGIEKNVKLWAPTAKDLIPLPHDAEKIMEANRQGREDRSRITLTSDVIMHVLRLQRRQTWAYVERRYSTSDLLSDEEDDGERDAIVLGYSDGDASSEDGSNPSECNIS